MKQWWYFLVSAIGILLGTAVLFPFIVWRSFFWGVDNQWLLWAIRSLAVFSMIELYFPTIWCWKSKTVEKDGQWWCYVRWIQNVLSTLRAFLVALLGRNRLRMRSYEIMSCGHLELGG